MPAGRAVRVLLHMHTTKHRNQGKDARHLWHPHRSSTWRVRDTYCCDVDARHTVPALRALVALQGRDVNALKLFDTCKEQAWVSAGGLLQRAAGHTHSTAPQPGDSGLTSMAVGTLYDVATIEG